MVILWGKHREFRQLAKWHKVCCMVPVFMYSIRVKGNDLSCVRSKPRWLPQSRTIRTGNLQTLRWSVSKMVSLLFIFTATKLLRLVMIIWHCLMVIIRPKLRSPDWMQFLVSLAILAAPNVSIFSRSNLSGSLTSSTWKLIRLKLFLLLMVWFSLPDAQLTWWCH